MPFLPGNWRIHAATEIEDINTFFGTEYSGEADTIGGLVIQRVGTSARARRKKSYRRFAVHRRTRRQPPPAYALIVTCVQLRIAVSAQFRMTVRAFSVSIHALSAKHKNAVCKTVASFSWHFALSAYFFAQSQPPSNRITGSKPNSNSRKRHAADIPKPARPARG